MITQRAFLLGIVAFCFYLIAIVNDLPPFYYLLTWLSVGILASSLGIALLSLLGMSCAWRLTQAQVTESLPDATEEALLHGPRLEVEIANDGTLNKTGVLVEVLLSRALTGNDSSSNSTAAISQLFLLEALPSGESLRTELVLRGLRRGRYHLEEIRLVGSDVLGLFRMTRRIAILKDAPLDEREVVVGPATVSWSGSVPEVFRQASREGHGATRLRGQSNDIRATRPYAPGDDLRHVHWKTTARRNQLVVKEFERAAERAPGLIIWDGAAFARWGQDGDNTTEWGLRLAASLHRSLRDAGIDCGVLRLDANPLLLPPSAENFWGSGSGQKTAEYSPARAGSSGPMSDERVVELFADADANRATLLSEAVQPYLTAWPNGLSVYLVTASLSPDIRRVARSLRLKSARLSVAFINGAWLLESSGQSSLGTSRGRSKGKEAYEYWPPGTQPGEANSAPVTEESYLQQMHHLGAEHIPTALLPSSKSAAASNQNAAQLRAGLHQMLSTPASSVATKDKKGAEGL